MPKPRTAIARHPRDQIAALRLALRITAGLMASTAFVFDKQPFGDAYEQLDWLRAALAPLARRDRLIRNLLMILDPQRRERRPWSSPRGAKRELLRLAACAHSKSHRFTPYREPSPGC